MSDLAAWYGEEPAMAWANRVCAWCPEAEAARDDEARASHGICGTCLAHRLPARLSSRLAGSHLRVLS